jgi:hypothetical protein
MSGCFIPESNLVGEDKSSGKPLTNGGWGYDFVVATTQASINSRMRQYLVEGDFPVTSLVYLSDPNEWKVVKEVELDDFLKDSNGANPFEVKDGTSGTDDTVAALLNANFYYAVRIQMGMPPGFEDDFSKLKPDVVVLGNSANNVTFNMFCEDLTVVAYNAPRSGPGHVSVYSQPDRQPWYFTAMVDLTYGKIDTELDDMPYFKDHIEEKEALKKQLQNLGTDSTLSLNQLFFDLDNAALQEEPSLGPNFPDGPAKNILTQTFLPCYCKTAKEKGLPLISIDAIGTPAPDKSQLQMTHCERQVNVFKDANQTTDPNNAALTTLDSLCQANNNTIQTIKPFTWNWIPEGSTRSGAIAIYRNTFADLLIDQLKVLVEPACNNVAVSVDKVGNYTIDLHPGQSPQTASRTAFGPQLAQISHATMDSKDYNHAYSGSTQNIMTYLGIHSTFNCTVSVSGSTVTVVRHLVVRAVTIWGVTEDDSNVYDKTYTDKYDLCVSDGSLSIVLNGPTLKEDHSGKPDLSGFKNMFAGDPNYTLNKIKEQTTNTEDAKMESIKFSDVQNFIFPGGRVFQYAQPGFSDHQDLVCAITYKAVPKIAPSTTPAPAVPPPREDPALSVTWSSDMMQNYLPGEVVSASSKFEALQTDDGHALLFGIDSAGAFHVIQEQSATSRTGWQVCDLSKSAILASYPGQSNAVVRNFDVGQSALDGTIGLAMAISSGKVDSLHVSLGNSSLDPSSWTASPVWKSYPFDAIDVTVSDLSITGILFAETATAQKQYLVVDIDRASQSANKVIERYYIDTTSTTGPYWVNKELPVDVSHSDYQSCVGRVPKEPVDGIYMSGKTIAGVAQLIYTPIENVYGTDDPASTSYHLPNGAAASAIVAVRNETTDKRSKLFATSDLYAVSDTTLYRLSADAQKTPDAFAVAVVTDDIIAGTDKLTAMTLDNVVTIWGRNGSDQVYYLSCPTPHLALPGAWSAPLPILFGVEHMSAFLNSDDGGNTIFASGGGRLQRTMQATDSTDKVWRVSQIQVEGPPLLASQTFNSYTTTIKVADTNGQPVGQAPVSLSTETRTPVYINGVYYVLSHTPATVTADDAGIVTVVEATDDLTGAILTVSCAGSRNKVVINPMEQGFNNLAALNNPTKMKEAQIPAQVTAGGTLVPDQKASLVATGVDVDPVIDNMKNLNTCYVSLPDVSSPPPEHLRSRVVPRSMSLACRFEPGSLAGANGDPIMVAPGDIFHWLRSKVKAVVTVAMDKTSGDWHFIAIIAGKAYHAALKSAAAAVGAVRWLFDAIGTGIMDLIHYISFLFSWDDIRRTKDVIHNLALLWIKDQVSEISGLKGIIKAQIGGIEDTINKWAGITDWSPLGSKASTPVSSNSSNPATDQTSGSNLLSCHMRDNAIKTVPGSLTDKDPEPSLMTALWNNMSDELSVLDSVLDQLMDLAKNVGTLSLGEILKKLAAILADAALSTLEVLVDSVIDVIVSVADNLINILNTKLHVPVISDILNAIGVPEISFLDLVCWLAAVPSTVIYKLATSHPPFPDSPWTQAVIAATSWPDEIALFQPAVRLVHDHVALEESGHHHPVVGDFPVIPEGAQEATFRTLRFAAGVLTLIGNPITTLEASFMTGENPLSLIATVMNSITMTCTSLPYILVPRDPIQNKSIAQWSQATTIISICYKVICANRPRAFIAQSIKAESEHWLHLDGRAGGSLLDCIWAIFGFIIGGVHLSELAHETKDSAQADAILDECAYFMMYFNKITYAYTVNQNHEMLKFPGLCIMVVTRMLAAGLQVAEASVW